MDKNFTQSHPIDNSALIHLAVHSTWHSNCFRLVAHLKFHPACKTAKGSGCHRTAVSHAGSRHPAERKIVYGHSADGTSVYPLG